jgi:hypothetical protein|tara:strand:- start:5318 stop:5998 length:681 start_codon:yes stop_codon:yes gene_type:complete
LEIKKETRAKQIISETINWLGDVNQTAAFIKQDHGSSKPQAQYTNLFPVQGITLQKQQLELSSEDLAAYLTTIMSLKLYTDGADALVHQEKNNSYFQNKNIFFVDQFYNLLSIKNQQTFKFIYKYSIMLFMCCSLGLIIIDKLKALSLIGGVIAVSAVPIMLLTLIEKFIIQIFFSTNSIITYYHWYLHEIIRDLQLSIIIFIASGLMMVLLNWFINKFFKNYLND